MSNQRENIFKVIRLSRIKKSGIFSGFPAYIFSPSPSWLKKKQLPSIFKRMLSFLRLETPLPRSEININLITVEKLLNRTISSAYFTLVNSLNRKRSKSLRAPVRAFTGSRRGISAKNIYKQGMGVAGCRPIRFF